MMNQSYRRGLPNHGQGIPATVASSLPLLHHRISQYHLYLQFLGICKLIDLSRCIAMRRLYPA
jgi:hypothetical protein